MIRLLEGEIVVKSGAANHFRVMEAAGGRLLLTNKRIIFEPHAVNFTRYPVVHNLQDVSSAVPCMTLWLFPNGLLITTSTGKNERFVVNGRQGWAREIGSRLGPSA